MSINMDTVISNMRVLMSKKVTYSMGGSRTGADGTADCSGAVYASLNSAGANLPLGNTDTLFNDLPKVGFSKVSPPYKYGDIFVWGIQGQSGGSAGHTGIFLDGSQIIHCNYGKNGVTIDDYNTIRSYDGNPPQTVFRSPNQRGGTQQPTEDATKKENTANNMDNGGEIEEYSYIGDKLRIKGWHFANLKPSPNAPNVGNGIPSKENGGGNSGSTYSVDWQSIQSRAQFFVYVCLDLGIPKNTILGLMANAYAESTLDPSALEPNGMGHGYFQWSYASNWGDVPNHMNRTYSDAKYQISFAMSVKAQWINAGYGTWEEFWKGTQSPEYLTNAWVASWERPASIGDRWNILNQNVNVGALDFSPKKVTKSLSTVSSETVQTFEELYTNQETMQIFDATNDELIKTVNIELKKRLDIKKENPDVDGVEFSGIDFTTTFEHKNPFYVQFMRVLPNGQTKILHLHAIFFPHSSSRENIGTDYSLYNTFKIQVTDKKGKTQFINDILKGSGFSYTNGIDEVPSMSLTIPKHELCKLDGHMDIKVFFYGKMFDGIVKALDMETGQIEIDHVISEWEYRQIPENYTVKNVTFPELFSQSPFLYSTDWYINADGNAQKDKVNYAFSKQNHLEALKKACELNERIYWRIGFRYERFLEIGTFGEIKNYILTNKGGQTKKHINIINNVKVSKEFDNVYNALTVYGEKSDSSQASLTLRESYLTQENSKKVKPEGFPIVIMPYTVNNEQKPYYTNITKIASNNSLEYTIIDEFSVALEQGKIIEKTKSFNDLAPFEKDGDTITDEEIAQQSEIAKKAGIKLLRTSGRRRESIEIPVGKLPPDINILDRIYYDYKDDVILFDGCNRYCRKVYEANELFYIIKIQTTIDENLNETNILTLSKELFKDD